MNSWQRLKYFTKPAVMFALLAWLWLYAGLQGPLFFFALGLLFSLAGDIFLLLPARFFLAGLVSFLLAHLAYITGLNGEGKLPVLPGLLLLPALMGILALYFRLLIRSLRRRRQETLALPITAYLVVLSLMLLSALLTLFRTEWTLTAAVLAASGGTLFFVSDGLLAWNRFISPIQKGRFWVRISYHLAQIALISGAAIQFISI